jgi:tetratricopeptide (TPR) repeat protein
LLHLGEAYQTLPDEHERAAVAQMLARTLVFAGGLGEATGFARDAAAALPDDLVDERLGLLAVERISGFMHGLDESQWRADDVPEIVGTGPGARMLAAEQAWELMIEGDSRARCLELCRFALEDNELLEYDTGLLWVVAAIVREFCDDDISGFWDEALAHAFARGSLFASLSVHLWRGYMLWRRGALREAEESLRTANEQIRMWGAPEVSAAYGHAFLIGVLLDQDETQAAREYLDGIRPYARLGDGARLYGEADAKVLYQEGRHAESLAALDQVVDLMSFVRNPVWRPWRSLRSHPLNGLGRTEEAIGFLEEELRLVRIWGAKSTIGRTLRMVAEMRDDHDLATTELTESIELLSGTPAKLQLARAHHAMGRIRAKPADAVHHLERALELAWECGARGMRAAIAKELSALGATVPSQPEITTLTTTERKMAAMASEGQEVRSIAQALFVTPRTVEITLAGLRERLGLANDAELAGALDAH